MSEELAKYETSKEVVPEVVLSTEDIKKYIAPKATDQELFMFVGICKSYGLNPFKREIHFVKYGDTKANIVVGYEIYLKRAERTGKLDGWKCWIEKNGDEKAVIEIKRKDWTEPFHWEVSRKEFDKQQSTWKAMPEFMLKKVAMAQGFRLAFPEDLGGLPYIPEEISSGKSEDLEKPEPPKPSEENSPKKDNKEDFPAIMARERKRLGDKIFSMLLGNNGFERLEDMTKRQDQVNFYKIVIAYPSSQAERQPGQEG